MTAATRAHAPLQAHQLVHGYNRGHRLLAGSTSLAPDTLRLVDRLSDASGHHTPTENSGYLTGYPLPDGAFALAMTWYAPNAPRPNVVWTHTLVLPPAALSAETLQPLVKLFRHPQADDLDGYSVPIPLHVLDTSEPAPVRDADEAARIVSALYSRAGRAWTNGGPDNADLCLAIWSQQWPRLRRSFSFCSGAIEPRRLDQKPFDLLLTPPGARTTTQSSAAQAAPDIVAAITYDLARPGEFRRFLRACGGDSGQIRSLPLLTSTWLRARDAEDPTDILNDIATQAPSPRALRKLKRGLLRGPRALLANTDPVLLLRALADPDVGQHVLAGDADIAAWAERAWQRDPRATAAVAAHATAPAVPVRPSDPDHADLAACGAVRAVVIEGCRPRDLAWLATDDPLLATEVLRGRTDHAWWAAWASLPPAERRALSPAADNDATAAAACRALLALPDGPAAWNELRTGAPERAARALLIAAADTGRSFPTAWHDTISRHAEALARQLVPGLPAAAAAALADTAPYARPVRRVAFENWLPLIQTPRLWHANPLRAAVLLNAALEAASPDADRTAGQAFSLVHAALAAAPYDDAWNALQDRVPAKSQDWDRCRNLARTVANAAAPDRHGNTRAGILDAMPNGPALDALREELERKASERAKAAKNKNPWGDLLGHFHF